LAVVLADSWPVLIDDFVAEQQAKRKSHDVDDC